MAAFFNMDGTFYLGENIIPGSLDFIEKVKKTGRRFIFFTNNASRTSSFYQKRLKRMGLSVEESDIVTAGDVTIEYLKSVYPGLKVYLNGTPLLEESFIKAGIRLTEDAPDVAIQSFDTTMDYAKMEKICNFVRDGVPFIATHMDINCPTETGYMPDCGAMVMGGLIVNYVKVKCGIVISSSGSDFNLQKSLFDAILPNILPLGATLGIYGLMQKKWTSIKIILLIVVVGIIGGYLNILVA